MVGLVIAACEPLLCVIGWSLRVSNLVGVQSWENNAPREKPRFRSHRKINIFISTEKGAARKSKSNE